MYFLLYWKEKLLYFSFWKICTSFYIAFIIGKICISFYLGFIFSVTCDSFYLHFIFCKVLFLYERMSPLTKNPGFAWIQDIGRYIGLYTFDNIFQRFPKYLCYFNTIQHQCTHLHMCTCSWASIGRVPRNLWIFGNH